VFAYHLRLAVHAMRRDRIGSLLVALAIGLGIGAVATMAALVFEMTRDPVPGLSDELFQPHLDASPPGFATSRGASDFDPGAAMTWLDAHNLLQARMAPQQAIMAGGRLELDAGGPAFESPGRYATAGFFALFGVPMLRGSPWTSADDGSAARVVVLAPAAATRLFGSTRATGRTVRIRGQAFRVVGVTGDWRPKPLFYGGGSGDAAFREDGFYLPLQTAAELQLPFSGSMTCWGDAARTGDGCAWLQSWVRIPANGVRRYQDFLASYAASQRARGRHVRIGSPALLSVRARLRQLRTVPPEVFVQCGLALAFFAVCLLNTTGLLLARFLAREADIGVRRALGATRRQIVHRFLVESAVLGVAGGVAGIGFAAVGLWFVRRRPDAYATLAHLHGESLVAALCASLVAAVCAGCFPAWRACRVPPAANLRAA
jgi:putative ABC transport system permease protein